MESNKKSSIRYDSYREELFVKRLFGSLAGAIILAIVGTCTYSSSQPAKYVSYERIPVEQVFRDSGGYRIRYKNKQNIWEEKCFGDWKNEGTLPSSDKIPRDIRNKFLLLEKEHHPTEVISDLEKEEGFANVLTFDGKGLAYANKKYVEIHLPKEGKLNAGNYSYGTTRHPEEGQMQNIIGN